MITVQWDSWRNIMELVFPSRVPTPFYQRNIFLNFLKHPIIWNELTSLTSFAAFTSTIFYQLYYRH